VLQRFVEAVELHGEDKESEEAQQRDHGEDAVGGGDCVVLLAVCSDTCSACLGQRRRLRPLTTTKNAHLNQEY
jgi:hypothetical protein